MKNYLILTMALMSAGSYAIAMEQAKPFTESDLFEAIQKFNDGLALDIVGSGQVNVNAKNEKGDTLLHRAAWQGKPMAMVIERLLIEGANPDAKNALNQTPLDKAIDHENLLVQTGGDKKPESYFVKWLRLRLKQPTGILKDEKGVIYRNPQQAITAIKAISQ